MTSLASSGMRRVVVLICLILLQVNISGCATIQPTIRELQQKVVDFWKSLKGETTEKQEGTREEAIKKYGLRGLKEGLIVEPPIITAEVVKPGDTIKQELQFALLATEEGKRFNVLETILLSSDKDTIELIRRNSEKAQGIHLSTIQFTIPKDLDQGEYKLISTISIGEQRKTVSGRLKIRRL